MVLVAAAITIGLAYLAPNPFVKGMIVGAASVATFGGIAVLVLLVTGTAQTSMGATAEQWTASELRPLRRAGARIINNLALQRWDIDHVAILSSGLFVIESKWSGSGWNLDRPSSRLTEAINQVRGNSRDLRLWQPVRASGVTHIQPVLFLWGGTGTVKPARPRRIDGVDVVHGIEAARVWRSGVNHPDRDGVISSEAIDQLWLAISSHIDSRDAHDAIHQPQPPTLSQIYWKLLIGIVIGTTGVLLCLKAFLIIHPSPWFALASFAAIAGGLAARRFAATRIAGLAWAVGVTGGLALIAFAALLELIS